MKLIVFIWIYYYLNMLVVVDTRGDRKRKFPDARSHQMQNVRPSACSEPRERVQDSRCKFFVPTPP